MWPVPPSKCSWPEGGCYDIASLDHALFSGMIQTRLCYQLQHGWLSPVPAQSRPGRCIFSPPIALKPPAHLEEIPEPSGHQVSRSELKASQQIRQEGRRPVH